MELGLVGSGRETRELIQLSTGGFYTPSVRIEDIPSRIRAGEFLEVEMGNERRDLLPADG